MGKVPSYLMNGHRRNREFFGRQEILEQIDGIFLDDEGQVIHDEVKRLVLCGMGGVGKTEIAIEYAFSRREKYDAIFWVDAETVQKLNASYAHIVRELGLQGSSKLQHDDTANRKLVQTWLTKPLIAPNEQRSLNARKIASWLLIFDNVDDPKILNDYWPVNGGGSVILTSRNPVSKDHIDLPTHPLDITTFTHDESAAFLQRLSGRGFESDSLKSCMRIARTLDGLPLAIWLMSGVIRRRQLSLTEFIGYYEQSPHELHLAKDMPGHDAYNLTISTVWMLEALSETAIELLQVLALLDPERIQEEVLCQHVENVTLCHYPKNSVEYIHARTELIHSSLITRDIERKEIRIHRLLQEVVRERMSIEQTYNTFESTISLLSGAWPFVEFDERNQVDRLRRCARFLPHVERIRSLFETNIRSGTFKPPSPSAALFNEVAWYLIHSIDNQ